MCPVMSQLNAQLRQMLQKGSDLLHVRDIIPRHGSRRVNIQFNIPRCVHVCFLAYLGIEAHVSFAKEYRP